MTAAPIFGPCKDCGQRVITRHGHRLNVHGTPLNHDLSCPAKERTPMPTVDPYGPPEVARDRWGRPLITPPDGGKPVAYTRCTTYVGCLEDTYNLSKWQQRMVALGLAKRPDLLLAVSAHGDDKKQLNAVCDEAKEAAAASAAATTGTALHRLAERLDAGEDVAVPEAARADMDAYRRVTAPLEPIHIERLTVQDTLKVAGTPDRVVRYRGRDYIADLKTGSLDFGVGKIAMQLAMYAHSRLYDIATGVRADLDVDLDKALIVHLPAGRGHCELVWVDIAAGWDAVDLARQVRGWRERKNLTSKFAATDPIADAIEAADSVDRLGYLWGEHRAVWTAEHTALAAARKAQIAA